MIPWTLVDGEKALRICWEAPGSGRKTGLVSTAGEGRPTEQVGGAVETTIHMVFLKNIPSRNRRLRDVPRMESLDIDALGMAFDPFLQDVNTHVVRGLESTATVGDEDFYVASPGCPVSLGAAHLVGKGVPHESFVRVGGIENPVLILGHPAE